MIRAESVLEYTRIWTLHTEYGPLFISPSLLFLGTVDYLLLVEHHPQQALPLLRRRAAHLHVEDRAPDEGVLKGC